MTTNASDETPARIDANTSESHSPSPAPDAAEAVDAQGHQALEIPKDYVPSLESNHALYHVRVPAFEGPLDLLLFLIRRHKVDVFDIPIAFICERYLEYLAVMEDLNIDVAAEFMVVAAELLHIKSRMLLPRPEADAEEEEVDPRAELVARLLEYQKYKDVAQRMGDMEWLGRDVFGRPPEAIPASDDGKALREVSVFALVEAFAGVLKRQKPEVRHKVVMESVSLRHRMHALVELLRDAEVLPFVDLLQHFDARDRLEIIITFLALLEMTRLKLLRVCESEEGVLLVHPRPDAMATADDRIAGVDDGEYVG